VSDQPTGQPEERPARYQRSIAGGVGSLVVLVLVVLGFVVFRGVFRDNDEVEQEPVDYLAAVQGAQQSGVRLVYPPRLPNGWTATSVAYTPGERPAWGIGMLTDDGKFVGVRQEDADVDTLLEEHVDANPVEGDTVTVDSPLASEWQEWSDAGGDHAYVASVGDDEVLVYGPAPTADLLTIVESLTDATVP
jgi:hypothetical protein